MCHAYLAWVAGATARIRVRESMEMWLTFASPQELQDLMRILLREIGKRSAHPEELTTR